MSAPERCPLCGHANEHYRVTSHEGFERCDLWNCRCKRFDYRAALRGYHSRDAEVEGLRAEIAAFKTMYAREERYSAMLDERLNGEGAGK